MFLNDAAVYDVDVTKLIRCDHSRPLNSIMSWTTSAVQEGLQNFAYLLNTN